LAPPHSRLRQPAAPDARPWPSSPPCFPYTPLFRSYFAPLDDYKKHVMTINAIGQELDRHAAQLVQTAAELQRTQYVLRDEDSTQDRKSTRLNSSHVKNSYAVFCLKQKSQRSRTTQQ